MSISKDTFNALLGPGPLWQPAPGDDLDLLLDGMSVSADTVADFLGDLAHIRDPRKTPIFEDLEREYGIIPDENVLLADRVNRLAQKVYQGRKINSDQDLQDALDNAGFDLQVHLNDPPVDPAIFLTQIFQMVAGGDTGYAGFTFDGINNDAFAGNLGGELLVNPEITLQTSAIEMQAGGDKSFAGYFDTTPGESQATAGFFTGFSKNALQYSIPPSGYWHMIYFVGGDATRDPVTDELTAIESGLVTNERRAELVTLILEYKPLMAWCGLIVTFD